MSDDAAVARSLALLQALYAKTSRGETAWQETINSRTFEAFLGDFVLRLRLIPDADYPDRPDYALTVVRAADGKEVDTISNASLRPVMDRTTADGLNPYAVLERTYMLARRQALNVDETLDTILRQLEGE
jgi:hypothetical protein